MDSLRIDIAGVVFGFDCGDEDLASLVDQNFGVSAVAADRAADVRYRLQRSSSGEITVRRSSPSEAYVRARDHGELLYRLEGDVLIQLQTLRPELLFLHAAVLESNGSAHLFVGESGAGKSTLCWGLVRGGLGYLSDELAPVDPSSWCVYPYPHAICLKRDPPKGFEISTRDRFVTSRGAHVMIRGLTHRSTGAVPAGNVFVVEYSASNNVPSMRRLSAAEAVARIYPGVLNALAHERAGMGVLSRLVGTRKCWHVQAAGLGATRDLVLQQL